MPPRLALLLRSACLSLPVSLWPPRPLPGSLRALRTCVSNDCPIRHMWTWPHPASYNCLCCHCQVQPTLHACVPAMLQAERGHRRASGRLMHMSFPTAGAGTGADLLGPSDLTSDLAALPPGAPARLRSILPAPPTPLESAHSRPLITRQLTSQATSRADAVL